MYIPRVLEGQLNQLYDSGKVLIMLGARQVGKTTLVHHFLREKKATFLNLDVEVDKQRLLAVKSLSPLDALSVLGNPDVLIVDEAQRLPETGRLIKGWYDTQIPLRVLLLGSSSLNLLDQTAESLTGRNVKLFLTPLIFQELLAIQSWYSSVYPPEKLQELFREQLETILLQTMVYGSYPEAITTGGKVQYLTNLVADYLLKDVLQLGLVKKPDIIRRLLMLLAHQTGSEVSVNELANNLRISRITVDRYLNLLERTFVIFRLPAYSTNPRKEIAKSQKIFFWDTGVRNALLNEFNVSPLRSDIGRLWENWVVAEAAKQNIQKGELKKLFFWRSRAGSEVDLIVENNGGIKAYEIKWSKGKTSSRSFTENYHLPVEIISHERPLFSV